MNRSSVYTTLTQLKMAMNNGVMPPMTPIPEDIQQYIDPDLTIGLGALTEDEVKGLRCPVKGCGEWTHYLTTHLNKWHAAIGGAAAVKEMLQIQAGACLTSRRAHEKASAGRVGVKWPKPGPRLTQAQARANQETTAASKRSMGKRNLANRCDAQVGHRLIDLEHQLGHSPSQNEGRDKYGDAFVCWIKRVYGSWNSAKLQCGLQVHIHDQGHTRESVIEVLREFHRINHRLPTFKDCNNLETLPKIPGAMPIVRALGATHWTDAMYTAAAEMGVDYTAPKTGGSNRIEGDRNSRRRKPGPNHPWRYKEVA